MKHHVIHIFGASGSGTSTLGRFLSKDLGYQFMDTDDYYWLPTNPMFTVKRDPQERVALMKQDIDRFGNVIISGSLVNWGDELLPLFTLAVRVVTDTDCRLARIRQREHARFGSRIETGGDMYQQHLDFLQWAAGYDNGDLNTRSRRKHDEWQTLLPCRLLTVNGEDSLEYNCRLIRRLLRD